MMCSDDDFFPQDFFETPPGTDPFEAGLSPGELTRLAGPPGWCAFAEPARREVPGPVFLFLPDVLEFLGVDLASVRTVTVCWGDDTADQRIDLRNEVVDYDHRHDYGRGGFFRAVVTLLGEDGGSRVREVLVQIGGGDGDVVLMEPAPG